LNLSKFHKLSIGYRIITYITLLSITRHNATTVVSTARSIHSISP